MAESTSSIGDVSSLYQLPKYFGYLRVRFGRAWEDMWRALGTGMIRAVVFSVCMLVVGFAVNYYAGRPENMSVALYSGFVAIATVLGAWSLTLLVYLVFYFFVAPFRIYEEDQEKIAELEGQLDRRLDLDVNVPFVLPVPTENSSLFQNFGMGGLMIVLQNFGMGGLMIVLHSLRLTNRSKIHKVSLSLTLRVRLDDALTLGDDVENPDYIVSYTYREHYKREVQKDFLFNPINIAPESTESGDMCFPVFLPILKAHEGKEVNYHSCLLDIFDHISGQGITKDIDQRFLESPTAQLVKK